MSNRKPTTPPARPAVEELEPRDVPAAGSGLLATYFDNADFTGETLTRVDRVVNFDWGTRAPARGLGADTFSVRWTGRVQPRFTEAYTFSTVSDDGVRLWVDGRLLIDNWTTHGPTEDAGTIALTAGREYDIRLEYFEQTGGATIRLLWSSPSQPRGVIPPRCLDSATSAPRPPAAPTGLTAAALSPSSVRLAWADNADDETGYVVERSADGATFAPLPPLWANTTTFDDAGLAPGTTYYYRVRAYGTEGGSAPSNVAAVRTPDAVTTVTVSTTDEFRAAVAAATPGTQVLVRPGVYDGGNYFANVRGEDGRPVVVAAADPADPPVFRGGAEGLHFSDAAYLELRNLVVEGASDNGINVDDGGTYDTPSHHVVLDGLVVRGVGSSGNQDGIKLSGVEQFRVENCTISAWGAWGSGIDMVGCHDGSVEGNVFRNGDLVGANGVEMKGGSARVAVRDNLFEHAGARAVQVGGSTEMAYFRPQPPAAYEAADVTVEGNVIIGSEAAVALVNADGAVVRFNTIYRPTRWAFRILQETTAPGFVPCRDGVVTDNIVAFRSDELATAVNVGPGTAPETFQFARNWWYCVDLPAASVPTLPVAESAGVYGIDPLFLAPEAGDLHLQPGSPAAAYGAYAPRP